MQYCSLSCLYKCFVLGYTVTLVSLLEALVLIQVLKIKTSDTSTEYTLL